MATYDGQTIRKDVLDAISRQTVAVELMVVSRPGGELRECFDILRDMCSIMTGDIVAFITCDMQLNTETCLEKLVEVLEMYPNKTAVGVKSGYSQKCVLYRLDFLNEYGFGGITPEYIEEDEKVQAVY